MIGLIFLLLAASPADPGDDVLKVFTARCAGCHSPAAAKVQGNFDYVLDLKRLAADKAKVVPGDPVNSDLWKLVGSGNMPPNDSPTGPLNDAQKEAIRLWIAVGAPAALPTPPKAVTTEDAAPVAPAAPDNLESDGAMAPPPAESFGQHLGRWFGESHLILLHFPIVCLLAAGYAEGQAWRRGQVAAPPAARRCIWAAALASIPTVVCGWSHAAAGHGSGSSLELHRWLGTSGGVLALLAVFVHSHGGVVLMPKQHALARRGVLGVAAALVTVAAHLGGKMAFGAKFLGW